MRWLGERILHSEQYDLHLSDHYLSAMKDARTIEDSCLYCGFGRDVITFIDGFTLNGSSIPEICTFGSMKDIVSPDAPEDIYISPVGCYGIVRRKIERNMSINPRLEEVLLMISSQMSPEEIERRSRIQHRGRFSDNPVSKEPAPSTSTPVEVSSPPDGNGDHEPAQLSLFDLLGS